MNLRPWIIDAHEDLAWNMATFGRDFTQTVDEIRRQERGTVAQIEGGDTLLGWDAWLKGRVAVVFATLFAAPMRRCEGTWDTICYADDAQAERLYRAQLALYHQLVEEQPDKFRLVMTAADMDEILAAWEGIPEDAENRPPLGLVVLMEGAEGVRSVEALAEWVEGGVRLIGPAWTGTRYCGGTREPGPLTKDGYALLDGMADHGLILDLSHMDEAAALQALDRYPGSIVATHSNAKGLLPNLHSNRFLTNEVISGIAAHDGVIGVAPYNFFLDENWVKGMRRELVSIRAAAEQIDYICQLAGDARHVGLGTDYNGGFGLQSVPAEVDTIADVHKLIPLLEEKGYRQEDISAIFGENWRGVLQSALP